jgi:hypothetical protein
MSVITIYLCGVCENECNSYEEADECCQGEDEETGELKPPTLLELEALGQKRLI